MASEDVIELGSSDDEVEPVPKKIKPNAMVHIPHKLSGVGKQSVTPNLPSLRKKLSGRSITIKKVTNSSPEIRNNRNVVHKTMMGPTEKLNQKAMQIKQALNPLNVKMSKSHVAINKVAPKVPRTLIQEPIKISNFPGVSVSSLPSSITIKKTLPPLNHTAKPQNKFNKNVKKIPNIAMQTKLVPNPVTKCSVGDVFTVELDDDDAHPEPATSNGPQWYLRPEHQKQTEEMEEQNNAEPKSSKFIEITIEDSPVKPINKTLEIGTEYAITIEDSPLKMTTGKEMSTNCSDEENKDVNRTSKSKKKLDYPRNTECNSANTVEIEIEPMEMSDGSQDANISEVISNDIILNSPQIKAKDKPDIPAVTIGTEQPQLQKTNNQSIEDNQFHPVYQSFINICFELENSEDMQKIVEKKIKGYYRQVPKEYTESEEFLDMVSSKIMAMKAGPERMYLYIKDVVDELNFKRKNVKPKTPPPIQETNDKEAEKFFYGEESEFDSKRQRQIRKLEKTLKKLHRAIQKLEEQEVDFDDEEDSVYLLTERYKERMIRVHAKFCQLTNTKMPSEPRVHIEARPGQPSGPAKRLEKMINKKVPIGTPLLFPDFHDVLGCVREANEEDKLGWNEADIMDEARDLFIRCGRKLQRRRQENEWRLAASRISAQLDPAAQSDELKKKLEQNKLLAVNKETEVFNKFADKQKQMKLEAVEIGDKEAEESPVESEDDDVIEEDMSLENSEKRKERLKRLLQKKYTKDSKKNEDVATTDNVNKEPKLNDTNNEQSTDITIQDDKCTSIEIKSVETVSETINIDDKVQSLSDDSSRLNSDIDELHLLQKLHSENEVNNSTQDSSDSESCIAISDSLDSSSESKKGGSEDVISIENSSYSEPEANEDEKTLETNPATCSIPETIEVTDKMETECSTIVGTEKKLDKSNNDEYNGSVENILLASSDEEADTTKKSSDNIGEAFVNLNDDAISIEETIIEENINGKVDITNSNEKENDTHLEQRSNHSSPKVDLEQKVGSEELREVNINNDQIIESIEPVLIENNVMNNCKETNITSTIYIDSIKTDLTSNADKTNASTETNNKTHTKNDAVEEIVGSTTEAMELVTTTSTCDDVNG